MAKILIHSKLIYVLNAIPIKTQEIFRKKCDKLFQKFYKNPKSKE
jgi:hypothetical protein